MKNHRCKENITEEQEITETHINIIKVLKGRTIMPKN
jgi:hypothetical protein